MEGALYYSEWGWQKIIVSKVKGLKYGEVDVECNWRFCNSCDKE